MNSTYCRGYNTTRSRRMSCTNENVTEPTSAILSDNDIRREMTKGNIICRTIDGSEPTIGTNSIDLTLGEYYYPLGKGFEVNTEDGESLAAFYGLSSDTEHYGVKRAEMINGKRAIRLLPGQTILTHTQEFVGGKNNITTMMKARSSTARVGASACKDAGMGDCGYCSRWVLQLSNHSESTLIFNVGSRIVQMLFFYCIGSSKSYTKDGQYQKSDDIEEIIRDWTPTQMVPSIAIKALKRGDNKE